MVTLDELRDQAVQALRVVPLRPIAVGGQKIVFLVERNGVALVLKLIQIGSADPTALERARREFDLLAGDLHPCLVKVQSELLTIGNPVEGVVWLEEFLDGNDVSALIGSKWPDDEVLRMGIDVSGATGALHRLGIIHRDLSAGNVRRLSSGEFKVMDPGFAKHTLRTGITVGGQPGTRGFMTPEHVQSYTGPIPSSDVFALGNLMYAGATGVMPFPYLGDDGEYIARLMKGKFVPIRDHTSTFPAPLAEVIEQALHPHPARRFRNGDLFRARLLEL